MCHPTDLLNDLLSVTPVFKNFNVVVLRKTHTYNVEYNCDKEMKINYRLLKTVKTFYSEPPIDNRQRPLPVGTKYAEVTRFQRESIKLMAQLVIKNVKLPLSEAALEGACSSKLSSFAPAIIILNWLTGYMKIYLCGHM